MGFVFYIFFMIIGVLSIIIGIFSQRALQASNLDRDILIKNQQELTRSFLVEVLDTFQEMSPDSDGEITWEHFRDHLKDEKVMAYFMSQGLNILDARQMFRFMDELDDDPSESMSLSEFIIGMMRLTGPARSCDMQMVLKESQKQMRLLRYIVRLIESKLPSGSG